MIFFLLSPQRWQPGPSTSPRHVQGPVQPCFLSGLPLCSPPCFLHSPLLTLACSSDETERALLQGLCLGHPLPQTFQLPILLPGPSTGFPCPSVPTCNSFLCFPISSLSQQFVSTSTHWLILHAKYTHKSVVTPHTLLVSPFCRNTICSVADSSCSSLPCCWYLGGQSERIKSLRAVSATQGDRQHFHHPVSSHTPRLESQTTPSPLLITAGLPTLHD